MGNLRKPSKPALQPEMLHVQVSTSREPSVERNGPRNLSASGSSRNTEGVPTPTATSSGTPFPSKSPQSPSGIGPTQASSLPYRSPQTQGQSPVGPPPGRNTSLKYQHQDGLSLVTELPDIDQWGAARSRSVPPGSTQEGSTGSSSDTRGNGFMRKVKASFSGRQPTNSSMDTLSTGSTLSYIDEGGSRTKRAHIGGGRRAAGGTQMYAKVREKRRQEDELLLLRLATLDVKPTVPMRGSD